MIVYDCICYCFFLCLPCTNKLINLRKISDIRFNNLNVLIVLQNVNWLVIIKYSNILYNIYFFIICFIKNNDNNI